MRLELRLVAREELVRVDYARLRRPEGRASVDSRLAALNLGLVQELERARTVCRCEHRDPLERLLLLRLDRHDELARATVRDVVLLAARVETLSAFHAAACLERVGRIVEPGVDDLAVSGGRLLAGQGVALEQNDSMSFARERGAACHSDHAGADDSDLWVLVHDPVSATAPTAPQ